MATEQRFAVPAPGKAAWITLLGLTIGTLVVLLLSATGDRDTVAIEKLALSAVLIIVAMLALGLAMRRRSVSLADGELVIRAAMYTHRTPLGMLDLDAARIVDLDEHREWAPGRRTNGFALPGFHAGHFRSRGRHRMFALVTDRRRVLLLPTADERYLLLSLQQPQALLATLRQRHDTATSR